MDGRTHITLTLGLSLAVHGIVLVCWPSLPAPLQVGTGNSLRISLLVSEPRPASASPPASRPEQQATVTVQQTLTRSTKSVLAPLKPANPEGIRAADNIAVTAHPAHVASTSRDNTLASGAIPVTTAPAAVDAESSRAIRRDLREAFQRYFIYPRLAVMRGWQGEVQLGLRIEADGRLSGIRILQGSGYELLDHAAMESLARVEILPAAVSWLGGRSLEVALPVEYRLL